MKKFISNLFSVFSFKRLFIFKILILSFFITSIFYISWLLTLENSKNKKYISLNLSFNNTCEVGHILESYITIFQKKRYIVYLQRSLNNEYIELTDLIKKNIKYCSESITYDIVILDKYKEQLLNFFNKEVYKANLINDYRKIDFNNLYTKLNIYFNKTNKIDHKLINNVIEIFINNQNININFNKNKKYSKKEYEEFLNKIYIFKNENSFRKITYNNSESIYKQNDFFKVIKRPFKKD